MKKAAQVKGRKLDINNFVMQKPKSKTILHTFILILEVAGFALLKGGIIFNDTIIWNVLFIIVTILSLLNIQKSIHRKIIVKNNFLTDANGNTYSFSDFTGVKVLNKVSIIFVNNIPTIRIENDDIGYDLLLEKLKNNNIKIEY